MQFRKKFTSPDADWRHPVDDIEPEESEACDSVELIGRVLRHLAGVRGLGVVALGDEAAALAALAIGYSKNLRLTNMRLFMELKLILV